MLPPVARQEVEQAVSSGSAQHLVLEMRDVVARIARHADSFADVLTHRQEPAAVAR